MSCFKHRHVNTANLYDIVFHDGSKIKSTSFDDWYNNSWWGGKYANCTPIGIVVIPRGFAPDGMARVLGFWFTKNVFYGSKSTGLTYHPNVITTNNVNNTSTSSSGSGYLPSDNFLSSNYTGQISIVDPKAKYRDSSKTPMIPSPYYGDVSNAEYYKKLSGNNNALNDFNGLSNTEHLVKSGGFGIADAIWGYNDGLSTFQWYLPSIGELGYIMARMGKINEILSQNSVAGEQLITGVLWSSTQCNYTYCWGIDTMYGNVLKCSRDQYSYEHRAIPICLFDPEIC